MSTTSAAELKSRRGRMLSKLTKVRRRAFVLIDNKGSRTHLIELMKELDDALQFVEDVNEELKLSVSEDSEKVQEADGYMKSAEKQHEEAYQRIQDYLKSRQGEEPSVVSHLARSQVSYRSSASRKAEVTLQIKQLEVEQLQRKHEREKEEQDLHRKNELQAARDAEEIARLEAHLTTASADDLNWDRRKDFDEEGGAAHISTAQDEKRSKDHDVNKAHSGGKDDVQPSHRKVPQQVVQHTLTAAPQPPVESPFLKSLPRLSLPKFSGSPGDWPRWFALFRTLIHDQNSLSSTEKMAHLQNAVVGPAQQLISGMFYEGILYDEALKTLENRFGRKEDIVQENMRAIFTCPSPTDHDLFSLEQYHSAVHSAVTVLQNLQYVGDLESTENLRRVVLKLPCDMKHAWSEHVVDMEPHQVTLIDFDQWLMKQVRISQKLASVTLNRSEGRHGGVTASSVRRAPKKRPILETRSTLATGTVTPSNSNLHCICCSGAHHLKDCSVFKNKDVDCRAELVLKTGTCFVCLKKGHHIRACTFNRECGIDGCRMRHHKLLHGSKRMTPQIRDQTPHVRESEQRVVAAVTGSDERTDGVTLLQIVPIRVHSQNGKYRDTLALLDPGSQTSLCSEEVIKDIELSGETQPLCIENVEGRGSVRKSTRFQLTLSPLSDDEDTDLKIIVPEAFSVPRVNVRVPQIPQTRNWSKWKHLHGLKIPDCANGTVEVLLGANVVEAVLQREARVGRTGEPVAVRTVFGWALTGTIAGFVPTHVKQVMFIHHADAQDAELLHHVDQWWKTESFGTLCDIKSDTSAEDLRSLRMLDSSVKKCGDRYEAGLLWRQEGVKMPDNREAAKVRLVKLEKSLLRNPKMAEAYNAAIKAYVEVGHARKLTSEEAVVQHDKLWLLPHHAVVNPNKSKLRVVFDAAASYMGVSLNSELMKGPDMLQNLVGILLRFRQEKVAIVGDITQMFHQVLIRVQDQPALSFWWRGLDLSKEPDMYRMQVAIFGARCSPAIASYVLQKAAEDGCTEAVESQKAKQAVKTSFYMDDFVKSEESAETASITRREVTNLLEQGGFHLTKWVSNDEEALSDVPETEKAALKEDATFPGKMCYSVLGCKWVPQDDMLSVKFSQVSVPATKRGVLKQAASLYDPLGMLTPFTLQAKKLIQELWRKKLDWDELLKGEDLQTWRRWQGQLQHAEEVSIPRWYRFLGQESEAEYELHMFSDASEHAFGVVAYVRVLSPGGSYSQLVMARSRLAPLRQLSIVRLELQGAVLSTRVADIIKGEIDYNFVRTFFWTDSRVVLQLLKNESRRYHTFVANRVSEIHQSTSSDQWHYVPGAQNPADLCSRGLPLLALRDQKEWWQGPVFLENSEEFWPQQEDVGEISPSFEEVKKSVTVCTTSHVLPAHEEGPSPLAHLIDPARFSSWLQYRRTVAWTMRFIKNTKCRVAGVAGISGPLQNEEIQAAETMILKTEQSSQQEAKQLAHLSPFIDQEGLMRVGGRLSKAPLAEDTRHPVILHANSDITRMIVADAHQRVMHFGLERTL